MCEQQLHCQHGERTKELEQVIVSIENLEKNLSVFLIIIFLSIITIITILLCIQATYITTKLTNLNDCVLSILQNLGTK